MIRRSITGPLSEVSDGARTLSGGDLDFDVRYVGRDEIGDVAAAFRDLHVTAGRLVGEIRATNAAIIDNRLDHRADTGAFEGTWAQLMAGMNDTIAAFAQVHGRRQRAEHELEGIFNLSLDLLCIVGTDGYFKRVNPAFERTLGYSGAELLSKPFLDFVHPDDRESTQQAHGGAVRGGEITGFENRYIRSDGAERWLQWSARPVPEEGRIYAAARDVTDTRRAGQEQAALRRVATLVAKRGAPAGVFDAVVAEMHQLLGAENTRLLRYEADHTVTVVAARSEPGAEMPLGTRYSLDGQSVSAVVWRTGRPARLDSFYGPPGSVAETLIQLGIQSAAGAPILVEDRLWGVMVAAWTRPHPASGIEDRIAQFTDLVATAISNAQARADLAASRARIVAASDQTRRRIERNLHDGAQQRLVSLGLALRAAQRAVPPGQAELGQELARVAHRPHRGSGGAPGDVPRHPSRHLVARRPRPRAEGAGPPVPGAGAARRPGAGPAARASRGRRVLRGQRGPGQRGQARAGLRGAGPGRGAGGCPGAYRSSDDGVGGADPVPRLRAHRPDRPRRGVGRHDQHLKPCPDRERGSPPIFPSGDR